MEVIVAMAAALLAVGLYRLGLGDGSRLGRGEPLETLAKQEEPRWRRVLQNINAYNGTPQGQREVGK